MILGILNFNPTITPLTKIAILALFRDPIALKINVYSRCPICDKLALSTTYKESIIATPIWGGVYFEVSQL